MSDMSLPWFVGTVEKLQECGIVTDGLRKSIDGLKAIVHLQDLSVEQFAAVRPKTSIDALNYEQAKELMSTEEWTVVDSE